VPFDNRTQCHNSHSLFGKKERDEIKCDTCSPQWNFCTSFGEKERERESKVTVEVLKSNFVLLFGFFTAKHVVLCFTWGYKRFSIPTSKAALE
jgi:hypothetical protein